MTRDEWCVALGRRLARLRGLAGLTLQEAATAVGAKANTIWRWEDGRAAPDSYLLWRYAAVLGVSVETVLPE